MSTSPLDIAYDDGAATLWKHGVDGSGVTIVIIDTAVDPDAEVAHPYTGHFRLREKLVWTHNLSNYEVDVVRAEYSHGTEMAGFALSHAPNCKIASIRVTDQSDRATDRNRVCAALDYAATHVRPPVVINVSIEFRRRFLCFRSCTNRRQCLLCSKINALVGAGFIVVAAAGNSGPKLDTLGCPGNAQGAITVGATDSALGRRRSSKESTGLDGTSVSAALTSGGGCSAVIDVSGDDA